ncbi:hypothetical protein ACN26Z_03400 [Verrucosispora sp. WMMD703]|uniref:PKD domain-containing protein n=1 Tax=Micromonospora sediminimaris TaxID=547162 RepID=A0A9W5UQU6_9ACTN|nr:hypothetical protein Vse01_31970 [Micromonospora sediminimaris]SFC77406.1 hypothetical protein SAMN05216284_107109 [Micromonospora sediminimaris]
MLTGLTYRRRPAAPRTGAVRRTLLGGALAVLLATAGAVPATAADPGAECPPAQPNCNVWDDDPGTPGGGGNGGDNGSGGDNGGGGGGGVCQWEGRTIPCYDDVLGWFNSGDGCYYKLAEPQPEAPEGQQWYVRTCYGGAVGDQRTVLLDAPPQGFGAPPDPEELARRAFASITLRAPRASVAPRKSIGPGLVGLPVWMWAEWGREQFGPQSATAEDRGLEVTIRAKVNRVVWDMGNGDTVTCADAGTEYERRGPHAGRRSPDCGYHDGYAEAGTYTVRATTHWSVTWTSNGGDSGSIGGVTRTTGPIVIQINELQVVTR